MGKYVYDVQPRIGPLQDLDPCGTNVYRSVKPQDLRFHRRVDVLSYVRLSAYLEIVLHLARLADPHFQEIIARVYQSGPGKHKTAPIKTKSRVIEKIVDDYPQGVANLQEPAMTHELARTRYGRTLPANLQDFCRCSVIANADQIP